MILNLLALFLLGLFLLTSCAAPIATDLASADFGAPPPAFDQLVDQAEPVVLRMARDPQAEVVRDHDQAVYRRRVDVDQGICGYAVRLWVRQRNAEGGLDGLEPWWVTFRDGEPVAVEFPLRWRPWKRDWEYAAVSL